MRGSELYEGQKPAGDLTNSLQPLQVAGDVREGAPLSLLAPPGIHLLDSSFHNKHTTLCSPSFYCGKG